MKKWSKKVWLSAVALVIAIMLVSAIPASADVSRVVYFSIQSNVLCDNSTYASGFSLNISNLSNNPGNITVYLYKKDGTQLTIPGLTVSGVSSDLVPGSPVYVGPSSTVQYYKEFGASNVESYVCSERPLYGKIVVNDNSGLFIASGEVFGRKVVTFTGATPAKNGFNYFDSTILINNGQPF